MPDDVDTDSLSPTPITHFSETERMLAESVSKWANEEVAPKVREMDEKEQMDPAVVEQMFEQGLMAFEIPEEYGGAGMNFTAAIVGIEEIARVDPSVSVMCDVHNTLVVTAILKYGSEAFKKEWLPKLATNTVGAFCLSEPASGSDAFALKTKAEKTENGYKVCPSPIKPSLWRPVRCQGVRAVLTEDIRSTAPRCGSQTLWKLISSSFSPTLTPKPATRAFLLSSSPRA
jgi:hypothetical protein